jgi:hypothetical protein
LTGGKVGNVHLSACAALLAALLAALQEFFGAGARLWCPRCGAPITYLDPRGPGVFKWRCRAGCEGTFPERAAEAWRIAGAVGVAVAG